MPEHRVAALAQGGIADARRHAEALAHRTALLPGPVDPEPAPLDIGAEGIPDVISRAQEFRQHDRVLDRLATALAHHRRTCTGGVADRHHAAAAPLVEAQPFDRSAVDLLVLV